MDGFRSMRSPASTSSAAYHVQLLSTMNEGSHSGLKLAKLIHPQLRGLVPTHHILSKATHSVWTSLIAKHKFRHDDEASFAW